MPPAYADSGASPVEFRLRPQVLGSTMIPVDMWTYVRILAALGGARMSPCFGGGSPCRTSGTYSGSPIPAPVGLFLVNPKHHEIGPYR